MLKKIFRTKLCLICGKLFSPRSDFNRSKLCSRICISENSRRKTTKKGRTKKCSICHKLFTPNYDFNKSKICSKKCFSEQVSRQFAKEITFEINGSCHECTSHAPNSRGYPHFSRGRKLWRMSRYLWTQKHGEIPKGMVIRHTCDNPRCINIDHLILGTCQDNSNDRVERNRQTKGTQVNTSKLTEKQVLEIKGIGNSKSQRKIAKIYNVSQPTIGAILLGKTWKHLLKHRDVQGV